MRRAAARSLPLALGVVATLTFSAWASSSAPLADLADAAFAAGRKPPSTQGAPYVVITSDRLAKEFARLVEWRTRRGLTAQVHTMSEVRDAVPIAADDAERVRTFLRNAHDGEGTRWVLLGGDAEVVPTRDATLDLGAFGLGVVRFPSDLYFACLDGSWNANGNGLYGEADDDVDLAPELFVGRAPVKTAADVREFVRRTIAYDRASDSEQSSGVVLVAGQAGPAIDLAPLTENLVSVVGATPGVHLTRLYANSAAWPGSLPANRATVLAALEDGPDLVVLNEPASASAIATADAWQADQFITTPDVLALDNAPEYFNVVAMGASINHITEDQSIGEALLRASKGGAATVLAPSETGFITATHSIVRSYLSLLYGGEAQTVGEAAAAMIAPFVELSLVARLSAMSFVLLGDPALHPRSAPAAPIADVEPPIARRSGVLSHATLGNEMTSLVPAGSDTRMSPAGGNRNMPARATSAPATGLTLTFSPNPIADVLRVSYTIPTSAEGAPLDLGMFDVTGRRMRQLEHGAARTGAHSIAWDLTGERGARLRSGRYFLRLTVGRETVTRSVIITR